MAAIPQAFTPVAAVLLTTFADPIYTVPAGEEQSVSIRVTNFSAAITAVTLWMVPPAGVRGDQHLRCKDLALAAKDTKDLEIALPLPPGTKIFLAAGAVTSIAASIAGTRNPLV